MSRSTQRFTLALIAIAVGGAIVCALIFVKIPPENESVLNIALGLVMGWGTAGFNYYFGTSESSAQKTEMMAHRPTGSPGDPVHTEDDEPVDWPRPQFGETK